jgi:hypothetical protein
MTSCGQVLIQTAAETASQRIPYQHLRLHDQCHH